MLQKKSHRQQSFTLKLRLSSASSSLCHKLFHRHRDKLRPVSSMANIGPITQAIDCLEQQHEVRVFSAAENPKAAQQFVVTMGQGFSTEPSNGIHCPDPNLYERRWRIITSNMLLRNPGVQMLHSTGPDFAAVAMSYIYPDEKAPEGQPEPPGIEDLAPLSRPETAHIRESMFAFMGDKKAAFATTRGSFQYIAFLASRPSHRGQGHGSRLLRHLTAKADAEGRWCYLEASNADNARLYERLGFVPLQPPQVWTLESLPGEKMTLIPMARPPAASAAAAAL